MARLCAYLRVSTDEQGDSGLGLEAQAAAIKVYCASQGHELAGMVREIESSRGKRPILEDVLQHVEQGTYDGLIVSKLDRLSRNTRDFLGLLDYCDDHACGIVSIAESFDTSTPVGRAVVTVLMAFAELERSQIADRMQSGRDQKARGGERNGAPVPYGYAIAGDGWEVDAERADVVRRIFDQFNAGASLRGIAASLNADQVPAPRGRAWYPQAVGYILDNGLYAGLVQYNGREGIEQDAIPAIIKRTAYDAAGARLRTLRRGNPKFGHQSVQPGCAGLDTGAMMGT